MFLSSTLKSALDFALPPRCPVCGVIVDENHRFCLNCWQELDFLTEPWCVSCGKPFAFERYKNMQCAGCLVQPPVHDGVRAVVRYDDKSSLLPMRLKYGGRLGLADIIGQHMERFLAEVPDDALLIPVPLHHWRLWSRGFNQAALIARSLARKSGNPVAIDIIKRTKATPPLRAMNGKQRKKIVKNAFALCNGAQQKVENKTVILVDDVYTTGSTASACAALLKKAGTKKVLVFCWARVLSEKTDV